MTQKLMATDVARLIVSHIDAGGYLGASWTTYVLPKGARVTQFQLDAGYDMADEVFVVRSGGYWGVQGYSDRNFDAAAWEA